jgi:hypothetical protein
MLCASSPRLQCYAVTERLPSWASQLQLNPRVWQELRHTNLAELAQQAPHLLPAFADGASSATNSTAAGGTADGAADGSQTGVSKDGVATQQQAGVDRSSRSAGSSGRQSSMRDAARCGRVVVAMQLSTEQRAALIKVCCLQDCRRMGDVPSVAALEGLQPGAWQ